MPRDKQDKPQNPKSFLFLLGSAWNIIGGMLGCSLLGYLIGKKLGDIWTGTLVGLFFGLVYCGYEIWRLMRDRGSGL